LRKNAKIHAFKINSKSKDRFRINSNFFHKRDVLNQENVNHDVSLDSILLNNINFPDKKVHSHSEPRRNVLTEETMSRQLTTENIFHNSLHKPKINERQSIIIQKQNIYESNLNNLNLSFNNTKAINNFIVNKHNLHSLDINKSLNEDQSYKIKINPLVQNLSRIDSLNKKLAYAVANNKMYTDQQESNRVTKVLAKDSITM